MSDLKKRFISLNTKTVNIPSFDENGKEIKGEGFPIILQAMTMHAMEKAIAGNLSLSETIAMSVVDESGNKVFNQAEAKKISMQDGKAIVEAINKFNGLAADDDDVEGND